MGGFANVVSGIGEGLPQARQSRIAEEASQRDAALKAEEMRGTLAENNRKRQDAQVKDTLDRLSNTAKDFGASVNSSIQTLIQNAPDPASTNVSGLIQQGRDRLSSLVDMTAKTLGPGAISKDDVLAQYDAKIQLPQSAAQMAQAKATEETAVGAARNANAPPDFVSVQLPGPGAGITQFDKKDPKLQQVLDGGGKIVTTPSAQPPEPKMVEALDTATGKPVFILESEALKSQGRYAPKPNGMSFEFDAKTGVAKFNSGGTGAGGGANNAPGVGTTGTGIIDTQLLAATAGLSRLNQVRQTYKPELLQTGTKIHAAFSAGREKYLSAKLSPEDQKLLTDLTTFRSDAVSNFNQYIKDQTGTALSPGEAERLGAALPVAGQTIWDGDSPTQFQSKMDRVYENLSMAAARLAYVRAHGLTINDLSLDSIPSLIDKRIGEVETEIKKAQPNIPAKDLDTAIKAQIAREFGLLTNG